MFENVEQTLDDKSPCTVQLPRRCWAHEPPAVAFDQHDGIGHSARRTEPFAVVSSVPSAMVPLLLYL